VWVWLWALALAQDEEVVVEAEEDPASASERRLSREDIVATPGRGTDELLRSMPGLHASSHGGTGKAYQLFVRGFDAVHGADVAVTVEGVPINEPSNVHGQGYLDLHLLPRVLVDHAVLRPGAFRPADGDFAVAGSTDFGLGLQQSGLWVSAGGGTDRTATAELAWRPEGRGPGSFLVATVNGGRGVGEARGHDQLRGAVGLDGEVEGVDLRAWALAYRGRFDSPGVLREDDLDAGRVDFYDAYPGSGGGASDRALASVQARTRRDRLHGAATVWGGLRGLLLDQNFTGFYDHPIRGDAVRQTHQDRSVGVSVRGGLDPAPVGILAGLDLALHDMDQTEGPLSTDGDVWSDELDAGLSQRSVAGWASVPLRPWPWLHLDPGARATVWSLGLDRRLQDGQRLDEIRTASSAVLAPRGTARLFPDGPVELDAAYGRGMRPPEVRGIESGPAPAPTADTAELGVVARHPVLETRAAAFRTRVANEVLFDPEAARFVATGETIRRGLFARAVVRPVDGLRIEGEATAVDAFYEATGEPVPFAPPLLGVGGLYLDRVVVGPLVLVAGVRTWALASRPLPLGFASTPATVTDATLRAVFRQITIDVDVDNVLGAQWRDGEFFFPSWWDRSSAPSALPERHISAGAPRALHVALGWRSG